MIKRKVEKLPVCYGHFMSQAECKTCSFHNRCEIQTPISEKKEDSDIHFVGKRYLYDEEPYEEESS
jgi:hypothetical protein